MQVASIRDLNGTGRAGALYPGFQAIGCANCSAPGHICNRMGAASQSLEEMAFERGLWGATMSNNLPKVQDMLSQGANPNLPDSYGFSALHYACTEGFPEIGELLLQSKANPNAQTYSSQTTPLHRAAFRGHSQIVLLLLQYGADPFLKDSDGLTPLHKASMEDRGECVRILVEAFPDTRHVTDSRGQLAADVAATPELESYLRGGG